MGALTQQKVQGTLQVTQRGLGFVTTAAGQQDIFIPRSGLNHAVHGDTVLVKMKPSGKRPEGIVERIINRTYGNIVGTVINSKTTAFIVPDDERLGQLEVRFTKAQRGGQAQGWKSGDRVVARFDSEYHTGRAYIIEVLGDATQVGVDILSVVRHFNLYEEFPPAVLNEARRVAVAPAAEEVARRTDFTEKTVFTIDPYDARDLDDAIHLEKRPDGTFELGVHIADVTHYVTEGSELDREAYKRGTSVYFPDRVLPMLPPQLSNDICSLNPAVPRLALSVVMNLNSRGEVLSHKITESVINVKKRYSYDQIQALLDGSTPQDKSDEEILPILNQMAALTLALEKSRKARGEVTFEVPEPRIILDEKTGKIKDVVAYPHYLSHRIIETFMVLCNEVVAEEMCKRELPFVYRTHEKPDAQKVHRFIETLKPFAVEHKIDPDHATGIQYQKMIEKLSPEIKPIISQLALRSMQKAKYMPECIGHFGLGAEFYCHFTSPIRRYPDLVIHRIIKLLLNKKLTKEKMAVLRDFVVAASEQSSKTELNATEAEREVDNLKRAEFMQDKIGEKFTGLISGIQDFGVFVYIPANTVEGLVRIENMPNDYYTFNETQSLLVGKKRSWRMGDEITVTVAAVHIARRQVEFDAN